MSKTLIREDKNGTKTYACSGTCGKCMGRGFIAHYSFNQGGVCFDCGGSGIVEWIEKEMTPEYEKKLEERRRKAWEKKLAKRREQADELNQKIFARYGYNENGKTYVVLGNTYPLKDRLKELGFKWDGVIGWHSPAKSDEFTMLELDWSDEYEYDNCGVADARFHLEDDGYTYYAKTLVDKANDEYARANIKENESDFVANVGDKIQIELTQMNRITCEFNVCRGVSSTSYLYIFEDENGNVFTWKSSNGCFKTDDKGHLNPTENGDKVVLKGTIKEHATYKGVKQTVLTRCKTVEG